MTLTSAWGIQTHAFYDEQLQGVILSVVPQRPTLGALESKDFKFAAHLTEEGLLECLEYFQPKDIWEVCPGPLVPKGDIVLGERVWDLQEKLGPVNARCDKERRTLRLDFGEKKSETLVATGDSLVIGLSANGELAQVWLLHIFYDYGGRKRQMLGWLKKTEANRGKEKD